MNSLRMIALLFIVVSLFGCRTIAPPNAAATLDPVRAKPLAVSSDQPSKWAASPRQVKQVSYEPPTLPPQAWTGGPGTIPGSACPHCRHGGACGHHPGLEGCSPDAESAPHYLNPWSPDDLKQPWPYDEYIWDGGDRDSTVRVRPDWSVHGLDNEDTVVHYDTRNGRRIVQPTNRVPIYAPRFASVRKVHSMEGYEGREHMAGVKLQEKLHSQDAKRVATTAVQPLQPVLQHGLKTSVGLRETTRGVGIETALLPVGINNGFLPHEDFLLIRSGQYHGGERANLQQRTAAAFTWSSDQMTQVVLEGQKAYEGRSENKPGETFLYELPEGKPRVRIVKVASKSDALPGDEVDFTIRFDNVGDQRIGNVTIIDSLTSRLEYVPNSAQCDLKANFGIQDNEAESLVLRWEIVEPLNVSEGGIIRFKCRVR